LTEHLKALHNFLTHPPGTNTTVPIDRDSALKLAQPPENVDKTLWLFELCRFLTQKVNSLIIALFSDSPPCSSVTCPEMRASEWQYLCAVHEPPKSCCAMDYCCHTLDQAANILTSPKNFPSRIHLATDRESQQVQQRHLTTIFRRVYRIFAHAWFQHTEMFWKVEGRTGLYVLFKTVCDTYGLISGENLTIPPEAMGDEQPTEAPSMPRPLILKREPSGPGPLDSDNTSIIDTGDHHLSTAGTTKRHRHSPSVGATSVHTVVEENEEEEGDQEEEPAKQESGIDSDQETVLEAPETSEEEAPESEQPPVDAEVDSTEEPEPVARADSHATDAVEEQAEVEPHTDSTDVEATTSEDHSTSADADPAVPEPHVEEKAEVEPHAEETTTAVEPEKAEKDDAAATADPGKVAEKEEAHA
jgi:hypothetical protein